ncbi:DNA/RNA non-specific endonuclease [Ligilactobacillus equi]|uniref:DNA-entry nuclease n=2 Tax=Ligilactobacillus equi TaxID=137357 RepID=V7HXG3_9LACO|nr:DNA/RNA non-specific endonuclease [Ligilactobacillus equi]ETA74582.1 DNA-entry nuclease [Ligilactobacillus equi DPC 6820]KRL84363.1 DNA-entry nuclease [Ligilactobacillus equi DSM 15833 = JCM 10991]
MNKQQRFRLPIILAILLVTLLGGGHFASSSFGQATKTQGNISLFEKAKHPNAKYIASYSNYPTSQIAFEGFPDSIQKKYGKDNFRYNGHGAFIINNNQTDLDANVSSAPYAQNTVDSLGRASVANALVNKTSRQYRNREQTNNGATNWAPPGYQQRSNLRGTYKYAYNRGHLLGYAIVGNISGFDASESNQQNIVTETSWANQAGSKDNTGQNYYEGLVRQAQDQNRTVRYRVTPVYEGNNQVPTGIQLEAKSSDMALQFNVYVPNVQGNIIINYANGATTLRK